VHGLRSSSTVLVPLLRVSDWDLEVETRPWLGGPTRVTVSFDSIRAFIVRLPQIAFEHHPHKVLYTGRLPGRFPPPAMKSVRDFASPRAISM
jgi:hypothetical protein